MNLDIYGNIFGFFLFFEEKSNFHIQTSGISKVELRYWDLLIYHFKWTISKHWNDIFMNLDIFGNIFGFFLFFVKKSNFLIQTSGIS